MRYLRRAVFRRRDRVLLWFAHWLAPVRWIMSVLVVSKAKQGVRDAVCERTPLPTYTCHQMSRRVRKTRTARRLTKHARRGVGGILKHL
jgi:hypothetical protein